MIEKHRNLIVGEMRPGELLDVYPSRPESAIGSLHQTGGLLRFDLLILKPLIDPISDINVELLRSYAVVLAETAAKEMFLKKIGDLVRACLHVLQQYFGRGIVLNCADEGEFLKMVLWVGKGLALKHDIDGAS